MVEEAKPPMPLVSSHSRSAAASRSLHSSRPKRIIRGSGAAALHGLLDMLNEGRVVRIPVEVLAFAIDAGAAPGRQGHLQRGPATVAAHRLAALGLVHELF